MGDGPVDLPDEDRRIEFWFDELVEDVALERVRRVCWLLIVSYRGCDCRRVLKRGSN